MSCQEKYGNLAPGRGDLLAVGGFIQTVGAATSRTFFYSGRRNAWTDGPTLNHARLKVYLHNPTDCVVRQIVSSDRLCRPTDCVVRQIVSSDRLCRPTDCVVRQIVSSNTTFTNRINPIFLWHDTFRCCTTQC
jgi:hypothetical protein